MVEQDVYKKKQIKKDGEVCYQNQGVFYLTSTSHLNNYCSLKVRANLRPRAVFNECITYKDVKHVECTGPK